MAEPIENFETKPMAFRGKERPVLVSTSSGPPVIILHEVFGVTATLALFAEMIRAAGFRIYMPVLFGSTEPKEGLAGKVLRAAQFFCVAHQFRVFASAESGPWADWLRDLVDRICADTQHQGAGVIGLCLTGNFALSMASNVRVKAPVMGEPSLPLRGNGLHVTPAELDAVRRRTADGLEVRGYRYSTDTTCPASFFQQLEAELGSGFRGESLQVKETLHSVFTEHLRDEAGRLRHDKVQEVIRFLRARLA